MRAIKVYDVVVKAVMSPVPNTTDLVVVFVDKTRAVLGECVHERNGYPRIRYKRRVSGARLAAHKAILPAQIRCASQVRLARVQRPGMKVDVKKMFCWPRSPPHIVLATFTFTSIDNKDAFLHMGRGPDGLAKTRACNGCRLIEVLESNSDPYTLTIRQEWNSQADHEAYYDMRVQTGMIDQLAQMMEGDIKVERFSRVPI